MKNKLILLITILTGFVTVNLYAGGHLDHHVDPLEKTFINNPKQLRNAEFQKALLEQPFWQKFIEKNGTWNVIFNENNSMPRSAYGKPVSVPGFDIRSTAENFMNDQLRDLQLPFGDFQFVSISTNTKYHYVNYKQYYQGLEVLFSRIQVKMMHDFRVNQFALGCHKNINVNITPAFNAFAAANYARANVVGVEQVIVNPDMKILPIPTGSSYEFHLVYDVMVENIDEEGIPGKYYTLVDATSGEILYRTNKVLHIANTDVNVKGTLHLTHPYDPATFEPMKNLKIVVNGITYYTDDNGYLGLTNTSSVTATISLQGKWVRVRTNNVTPQWTVTLNPGQNDIDVDQANTDIKQRTTYDAINTVHDYMKTKYPTFTGLDNPMIANIDEPGTCNAFYNGSSVNFFDIGGGCNATSLIQDIAYHEYGHAINDRFYLGIGASFDNGAMNEGYADLWAMGITANPILGTGFSSSSSLGHIRRYDINKKVFPADLVGEVHADGEIIAGCFWDTGLNLGNLQQMMDLFKETFYAGITGPNGDEGNIFLEVLLETLTQDDNDGDLSNGTPNYCPITAAFTLHGIDLGASIPCSPLAYFTYNPNLICAGNTVTFHDASSFTGNLTWDFPGGTPSTSTDPNPVITYNTDGIYDVTLTVDNGNGVDSYTMTAAVQVLPGVGQSTIPFFEGFENISFPNTSWPVENDGGNSWQQNTIAAKTGVNSVYIDNFNGNTQGSLDAFNTPSYDLSTVTNASMTFELAYALTDFDSDDRLKVLASTSCGLLWSVRYNKAGAALATAGAVTAPYTPGSGDWVQQSVSINTIAYNNKPNVRFRFEYTHDIGNNIFIDDINIDGTVGLNEVNAETIDFNVYPNPVSAGATVSFVLDQPGNVKIDVLDVLGREVEKITESDLSAGEYQFYVPSELADGMYHVRIILNGAVYSKKIFINKE